MPFHRVLSVRFFHRSIVRVARHTENAVVVLTHSDAMLVVSRRGAEKRGLASIEMREVCSAARGEVRDRTIDLLGRDDDSDSLTHF